MSLPSELKYTKDHEWVRVDGEVAYVGITDFAQQELGDIVFIEINSLNSEVAANDVFGTVEAVKTVSDLFMPVTATIAEVNSNLDANPELVNKDPFGDGWMIKISAFDQAEVDGLLSYEEYKELTGV